MRRSISPTTPFVKQVAGDLNGEALTLFSISRTYAVLYDKQREQEFNTLAEQLRQKIELARATNPENRARLDQVRPAVCRVGFCIRRKVQDAVCTAR